MKYARKNAVYLDVKCILIIKIKKMTKLVKKQCLTIENLNETVIMLTHKSKIEGVNNAATIFCGEF